MYVLPNRKAFADSITRILMKYRSRPTDDEDKDVDVCAGRGSNARELLPHQKVIRDYLMMETPYRGVLLYHGLGSGKTCSSIAVAESLLSTRKVFVMLPASLESNYRGELRKCGDPIYTYEQHWRQQALTDESRKLALSFGISEGFLDRNGTFFITVPNEQPNFANLPKSAQDIISAQIEDIINQRFTFIRYNGLTSANIDRYVPPEGPNPFDESVVIIDEVHNLISRITNASDIGRKLYDAIYNAKECKVVALSGTPVINRAFEIAYLMNLLRGPIERIKIPVRSSTSWDEEKMKSVLHNIPDIDTIEFISTAKKYILLTRNPPHFRSVYGENQERIAVQYVKDMEYVPVPRDWVKTWKQEFETEMAGTEIELEGVTTEMLTCLPTVQEEFANLFLDGLNIKNALLFQRRIQGLVSYFKGADERMLPRRVDDDKMLEKVPFSDEQFNYYLNVRFDEIRKDARKRLNPMTAENNEMKSFRVNSRLACNYTVPQLMRPEADEDVDEDEVQSKGDVLAQIRTQPDKYLSPEALKSFSPKLLRMLENVKGSMGKDEKWNNQFVYSQFRELEGLGIFAAILDANGWQPYRIVKEEGVWKEDPSMDPEKPAYCFYTGGAGVGLEDVTSEKGTEAATAIKRGIVNAEQREMMRQIFNEKYADDFPPSLKQSVESATKKKLCLLMASSAGAEGITLANVRHVHIMEPHWNPARHDQVIGRAIRICSHASLPNEERTVRISFYISVFTKDQATSTVESTNVVPVRRADTVMKRYEGDPEEVFMTTDEYLFEKSFEKEITNKRISLLLKQAAVDCEVHRKLHSREKPVISCMRFDSTVRGEDLAFRPNIMTDETDAAYLRNMIRKKRRLQKVSIKQMLFYIDPDTKEVFDGPAFEDNKRLLRLGLQTGPTQIRWLEDLKLA